jgi:hypothetical protein
MRNSQMIDRTKIATVANPVRRLVITNGPSFSRYSSSLISSARN